MPEETPAAPLKLPQAPASPEPPPLPHLGVEFGTAKRNLPPAKVVVAVLAVAAVLLGVFSFVTRAKPQGGGSVDNIVAIEVPDQNLVLVAVNISLHNTGEKPLWIRTIKATLTTGNGEFSDEAASAVDFERYFQAFPGLKVGTLPAIPPETKIAPGGEASGTVIVGFHVTKDAFDKRKSLSVAIQPYDQALPVTLTR